MSNLGNYSPYNKTFKFIMFQNQAYHEKAKRNMIPVVRTNLRYNRSSHRSRSSSTSYFRYQGNPENQEIFKNLSEMQQDQESPSPTSSFRGQSMVMSNSEAVSPLKKQKSIFIDKEKQVVHKNQSFEKFRTKVISRENKELVDRLLIASPEVIKNKSSQQSFDRHLKYREIRKVYRQGGKRKHPLVLGKEELLCPTLSQFHFSGLGPKFLEKDLSMCSVRSVTGSRLNSPRKSYAGIPMSHMRLSQV